MGDREQPGRMQIGEVLKSTRTRHGLDIRTVEERTKIRTKYLRALEAEDWDVLPSPAYAKGFLRTYAQLLDLDADALVDEFRRQVEVRARPTYPIGREQVLERRRRLSERREGPRLGPIIGLGVLAALGFLLILGLTGGADEDAERAERREARQERQERRRERRQEARQAARQDGPVRLRVVVDADVRLCLVGDGNRPLIDGQILPAGTQESFQASRFRLQFPTGFDPDQLRLFVGGERTRLPDAEGAVSYRIAGPQRVSRGPDPGPGCP